ncbi:MAG: hypothetical protein ACFE9Z_12675 [Promethearchaeota archaeon]
MKILEKKSEEMDLILDYYKDWDSYSAPVMLLLNTPNEFSESLEAEDSIKLDNLRKKYQKSSR